MVFPEIPKRTSDKPWRSIKDLREGELVFYPTHGVGHVEKLRDVTAAGYSLKIFEVIFWNDNRKLSIPVNKSENSGLRRLLTPENFQRAIDVLKSPGLSLNQISQQNKLNIKQKVLSGDPSKMFEVIRDFLIIAETTDQLEEEKSLVQMAFDNLVREFSAIHRMNLVDAAQNIRSLIVKPAPSSQGSPWVKGRYPTSITASALSQTPANAPSLSEGSPWVKGRYPSVPTDKLASESPVNTPLQSQRSLRPKRERPDSLPTSEPSVTLVQSTSLLETASVPKGRPSAPRKIILAGSFATDALQLKREGLLRPSVEVALNHVPSNPHDPHAISVSFEKFHIGWIPKSQNQAVLRSKALNFSWKILAIKVLKNSKNGIAIEIYAPDLFKIKSIPKATKNLPTTTRREFSDPDENNVVYKILCRGRVVYVGSTTCGLKKRKAQHLRALRRGEHTNHELQALFDVHEEEEFHFVKTRSAEEGGSVRSRELDVMKKYRNSDYKKTIRRQRRFSSL
jgi:CarD family transcriptional regulator